MFEKLLAKRHIQNLDLASIRAKLVTKEGWSAEQALKVEGDYKRFLYALAHKRPDDILSPPTQEIDEFWHQHILDTRKYREDCILVFGHYVDHTPGLSSEQQRQADARRRQIYRDNHVDSIDFGSSGSSDGGSYHHDSHSHGHSHGSHDAGHDGGGHSGDSGHGGSDSGGHSGGGDSGGGDSGGGGDGGGSCGGGGGCGGGGCGGG